MKVRSALRQNKLKSSVLFTNLSFFWMHSVVRICPGMIEKRKNRIKQDNREKRGKRMRRVKWDDESEMWINFSNDKRDDMVQCVKIRFYCATVMWLYSSWYHDVQHVDDVITDDGGDVIVVSILDQYQWSRCRSRCSSFLISCSVVNIWVDNSHRL